jgi:hypothetical protein
MHRLYRQIYLTIIASLMLVVLFGGLMWRFAPHPSPGQEGLELIGEIIAPVLPPADADDATQQRTLDRIHVRLKVDLALFDGNRRLVAAAGSRLPTPVGSLAVVARHGQSGFPTTAGWSPAPRDGVGIRSWVSSPFWAASPWRWRSAPTRWCAV